MSVEATALSRSKLEQKDRSELAAIVEAMGGKPASRAKKADLVDQVLQLAGAGNGTDGHTEPAAPPRAYEAAAAPLPTPALDDEPLSDWELAVAAERVSHARSTTKTPASTPSQEQVTVARDCWFS